MGGRGQTFDLLRRSTKGIAGTLVIIAALLALWGLWPERKLIPKTDATPPRPAPVLEEEELPLPNDPSAGTRIIGRVLLSDGTPAPAGLSVALARQKDLTTRRQFSAKCTNCEGCSIELLEQGCQGVAPEVAPMFREDTSRSHLENETTTRIGGRFNFASLEPARYALWALGESGRGVAFLGDVSVADQESKQVTLTFAAPGELRGAVLDKTERTAIAEARVIAVDLRMGRIVETLSDGNGRFELAGLDPAENYYLQADGEGWSPASQFPARTSKEFVLEVERAASIDGVVTLNGRPAAGVTISTDFSEDELETEDDGAFHFTGLTPGVVTIYADGDDDLGASTEVFLQPGEKRHLEIALRPLCSLEVRVLDRHGEPLADTRVDLAPKNRRPESDEDEDDPNPSEIWNFTDEDGTIQFDYLLPGLFVVSAGDEDSGEGTKDVHVCLTKTVELTLVGQPGVTGRVLDENKKPIDTALIELASHEPGQSVDRFDSELRSTYSDAKGRFSIANVGTGSWELTASHRGYKSTTVQLARKEHDRDLNETVVLTRGASISGRVVDAAGHPLHRWMVQCMRPDTAHMWLEAKSRKNGTFRIRGLEDRESCDLIAHSEDDVQTAHVVNATAGDEDVVITAESEAEKKAREAQLEELTKPKKGEGGTLTGRVVDDETSKPIAGANIEYFNDGQEPSDPNQMWIPGSVRIQPAESDAQGAFRFESVPRGAARVTAIAEGHPPATAHVEVRGNEDEPIVVRMRHGVKISGHVRGTPNGSNASLMLHALASAPDDVFISKEIEENGSFTYLAPRAGRYRTEVFLSSFAPRVKDRVEVVSIAEIDVPESGRNDVELAVSLGASSVKIAMPPWPEDQETAFRDLEVLLLSAPAELSRARDVWFHPPPGTHFRLFGELAGKELRIDRLAAGEYTLVVRSFFERPNYPPILQRVRVDGSNELNVALRR